MKTTSLVVWGLVAFLIGFVVTTGCAVLPTAKPAVEDVAKKREPRQEEVLGNFERRRDAAQLEAAAERLKQGDSASSEAMLKKLLERNADYAPARLLLARVMIDRQDYAGAEQQLRQIIAKFPKEAAAHFELGMLLDEMQRTNEAVALLAKASELEPSNELYRLSYQSLSGGGAKR